MLTSEKRQSPLSAAKAWEKLRKTLELSQINEGRKTTSQTSDAARLLEESVPKEKPKRYQEFLLEILNRCGQSGPAFVVLCAIALGQAQVAMMNAKNRASLLGILERNIHDLLLPKFHDMAPDKLKGGLSPIYSNGSF